MIRLLLVTIVVAGLFGAPNAQDPHVLNLPPEPAGGTGEVIDLLIVGAEIIEDGRVMFFVPQDAPDPRQSPPPPSVIAKVDGKVVRAIGMDGKPLADAELKNRLPTWTSVVVIPADLDVPDPFYMKVLNERTVTFVVPKKLLLPMAKAARTAQEMGRPEAVR